MKPIATSILNLGRFVALPLAGLILAAPASAQDDPLLEEITVVAQKREQNIMDVPVAITAVTGYRITPHISPLQCSLYHLLVVS